MNLPELRPPSRHLPPVLAVAVLAAAGSLAAQQTGVPISAAAPGAFPLPLWLALLIAGLCGALGAFAADLVADGGRIEQWRRDEGGWSLGFPGKMVIGFVAAIVFLTLNPPGGAWVALVGSALVAGLGGEAILLAIIASRRAQVMEQRSREGAERSIDDLQKLRALTRVAGADRKMVRNAAGTAAFADAAPGGTLQDIVDVYVDNAIAEVRRRADRAISQ